MMQDILRKCQKSLPYSLLPTKNTKIQSTESVPAGLKINTLRHFSDKYILCWAYFSTLLNKYFTSHETLI